MDDKFELYIWPGIGDLISISPECIATSELLKCELSSCARDIEYKIIPTYDPSAISTKTLPALSHRGKWFYNIFTISDYVTSLNLRGTALNEPDNLKRAEALAISHHLRNTAQPLVDSHLYINNSNYSAVTYKAYKKWLPFPLGWMYPSHRYSRAVHCAASVGLAEHTEHLRREETREGDRLDPIAGGHLESSTTPSLLFARSKQAQKTLKEQADATRFRLQSAIDAMCDPVVEWLSKVDVDLKEVPYPAIWLLHGYLAILADKGAADDRVWREIEKKWPSVITHYHHFAKAIRDRSSKAKSSLTEVPQKVPSISTRISYFSTAILSLLVPQTRQTYSHYVFRTLSMTGPLLALGIFGALTGVSTMTYAIRTFLAPKNSLTAANQRDIIFARPKPRLSPLGESDIILSALFGPPTGSFDRDTPMRQEYSVSDRARMTEEVERTGPKDAEAAGVGIEVGIEVDKAS